MEVRIETDRLILRSFNEDDVQGIFELDSDPEVHRYLGNKPITTMDQAKSIVAYILSQYDQYGMGRLAIVNKATNEFVGWSGIKYETEVRKNMPYYDIGYRLKRKFWGQGIASEAAHASIDYGFNTQKLKEIYGGADIDNIASNKILQKIGLQWIETFEFDGAPHHWYGIKREDLLSK